MANVNRPFGFVPIGTSDGADYHGKLREVEFAAGYAVDVFVGDMVKLTGTTGADGVTPQVELAAPGEACIGAIDSVDPDLTNEQLTTIYRPASTARKAKVAWGSDVLYAVQTSNGTITAGDFGENIDLANAGGSTITGISGQTVDVATAAAASGQFRLHKIDDSIDNELAEFARVIVNINENQDDHGAGV